MKPYEAIKFDDATTSLLLLAMMLIIQVSSIKSIIYSTR